MQKIDYGQIYTYEIIGKVQISHKVEIIENVMADKA